MNDAAKNDRDTKWETVKEFVRDVEMKEYDFHYTLVAKVTRLNLDRPRYSLVIGRRLSEGKFGSFLPVFWRKEKDNARLITLSIAPILTDLIAEAEEYITKLVQS